MMIKYFKTIIEKTKKYDKKAQNPFLKNEFQYNPFKSVYEQTYMWITNSE